jgi:hypothetical protein
MGPNELLLRFRIPVRLKAFIEFGLLLTIELWKPLDHGHVSGQGGVDFGCHVS